MPIRLVSTAPSITEMAFALGLGPRIVGVSDFCVFPADAARLSKVGSYLHPSTERILGLSPDLVLVDAVQENTVRAMQAARVPVLSLKLASLSDVRPAVVRIGEATGKITEAKKRLAELDRELGAVPKTTLSLRTLLIIGRDPGSMRNIYAAGPRSYVGELLALAGGKNVLGESQNPYPKLAVETILALGPDVVLEVVDRNTNTERARADWNALPSLPAVRQGRVIVTADQLFTTPGLRAPIALRKLTAMLAGSSELKTEGAHTR